MLALLDGTNSCPAAKGVNPKNRKFLIADFVVAVDVLFCLIFLGLKISFYKSLLQTILSHHANDDMFATQSVLSVFQKRHECLLRTAEQLLLCDNDVETSVPQNRVPAWQRDLLMSGLVVLHSKVVVVEVVPHEAVARGRADAKMELHGRSFRVISMASRVRGIPNDPHSSALEYKTLCELKEKLQKIIKRNRKVWILRQVCS